MVKPDRPHSPSTRPSRPTIPPPAFSPPTREAPLPRGFHPHQSPTPTPATIAMLQRTVGNRAVTAWMQHQPGDQRVMQRVIAAPNLTPSLIGVEQARLQAIAQSVNAYNGLNHGKNNAAALQARFSHITQLERLIYAWYDAKQVPNLTDNADPALGGNATVMRSLLRNTENERTKVVSRLRATNTSITFDGANPAAVNNLQTLWTAIVNQTGNLQAMGNAKELNRLFSRIAAALQTDTGRQILDYMVNNSPNTVTMLYSTQANLQQIAATSGAPQGDQDQLMANEDISFAGQRNLAMDSMMVRDNSGQAATALTTPDALINDVTGGNPAASYSTNGVAYRPGTGRNAFAAIKPGRTLATARQPASSAAGNEVLTPNFITLMHELGHALKMASGTYMPQHNFNPDLTRQMIPNQANEDFWPASTLEEYVNVQGVENPIRQEAGISTRDTYETPEMVRAIQARQQAEQQWIALRAADTPDVFDYLQEVQKRCDRLTAGTYAAINIFRANTAADVALRTAPINNELNPANQLATKRAYITQAQTDFTNFLLNENAGDRAHLQRTQRYQTLNQRLTNLVNLNQTALGVHQTDVRAQVDKFILDRATLIAAGKKILHVNNYGLKSPKNWGIGGRQAHEGTP